MIAELAAFHRGDERLNVGRRITLGEIGYARSHPEGIATLLLVRWVLDSSARASSGWDALVADLKVATDTRAGERTLTPRRLDYLQAFAAGFTRAEVGELHGVGEETIKSELVHIREALDARNVTHAVAEAIRRELI